MDRSQKIIRISFQGILVNLGLVITKVIVAFFSNSLAIFLDGINNLSDSLSSVVIILATRLSKKPRDAKHPFGFGRIEYLSTLVLAILILFTGFQSLVESVDKIFHPTHPDYSWVTFLLLILAAAVKYFFGTYLKKQGNDLNALSLSAAGSDAVMDSRISISTVLAAGLFVLTGINLDGWVGALISILIIKTGLEVLRDGTSSLIGQRSDPELTNKIIARIDMFPEVLGAYDLILHEYGPDTMIGSVHIEVNEKLTALQIDRLSRNITAVIYKSFSTLLTVGVYASNSNEEWKVELERKIRDYVLSKPHILQIHGFYLDEAKHEINFDLVYDYELKEPEKFAREISEQLHEMFPEYRFYIVMDFDYSVSS